MLSCMGPALKVLTIGLASLLTWMALSVHVPVAARRVPEAETFVLYYRLVDNLDGTLPCHRLVNPPPIFLVGAAR
jgi:hypothetical protein